MPKNPASNVLGRVLIVEDNGDSSWLLSRVCRLAGYSVHETASGQSALDKLEDQHFDVMLLDLHLPDLDGVEILKNVNSHYPDLIKIIVTANPSQESAISAIKAGADDYLCKPVTAGDVLTVIAGKLAQRAERHLRFLQLSLLGEEQVGNGPGMAATLGQEVVGAGDSGTLELSLDQRRQEVKIEGERNGIVPLTKGETEVMAVFLDNAGKVLSPQDLAYGAWNDRLEPAHAASIIRPLIFRLRQKLEEDPGVPHIIRTVRGAGYVYDAGASKTRR